MKFTIHVKQSIQTLPPGIWAFVLHDYQTEVYNHLPRPLFDPNDKLKDDLGWPEMCPLAPRLGVKLTRDLQWFWVKQLVLSRYGIELVEHKQDGHTITIENEFYTKLTRDRQEYIKNAWAGLTKQQTAFTNGRGTDTGVDYIRKLHMGGDYPLLFENTCGGSLLELAEATPLSRGYKVRTLDPVKYLMWKNYTYKTHPQFFTWATNSTPYGFNGIITKSGPWRVDPFHYLSGKGVPVPLISGSGIVYVPPSRVRILQQGEKFPPHPYNP
jgi:hypothetical protein